MFHAGLITNRIKGNWVTSHQRLNLYFDVGLFRMFVGRWDALRDTTDAILASLKGRAQSLRLAIHVGTVCWMKLAPASMTQLYSTRRAAPSWSQRFFKAALRAEHCLTPIAPLRGVLGYRYRTGPSIVRYRTVRCRAVLRS